MYCQLNQMFWTRGKNIETGKWRKFLIGVSGKLSSRLNYLKYFETHEQMEN